MQPDAGPLPIEVAGGEAVGAASELLQSDRVYFRLGAEALDIPGGELCLMPEFADHPVGAVAWVDDPPGVGSDADRWIARLERTLRARGCAWSRFYLTGASPALAAAAVRAGYRSRLEVGFVIGAGEHPDAVAGPWPRRVVLRPVLDEADWRCKERVHDEEAEQSRRSGAARRPWVSAALERRKAACGRLRPYLIEAVDDHAADGPAGTLALMRVGGLLRLKSLLVRPAARRQGLGAGSLRVAALQAGADGCHALGLFGVAGTAGDALYRRAGVTAVTRQVEWTRALVPPQGAAR